MTFLYYYIYFVSVSMVFPRRLYSSCGVAIYDIYIFPWCLYPSYTLPMVFPRCLYHLYDVPILLYIFRKRLYGLPMAPIPFRWRLYILRNAPIYLNGFFSKPCLCVFWHAPVPLGKKTCVGGHTFSPGEITFFFLDKNFWSGPASKKQKKPPFSPSLCLFKKTSIAV